MKKVLGIFGLLIFVCLFTTINQPDFISTYNIQNTLRWTSFYGIISIGVAFVIITGGIDLSIGSLVGLVGCALPMCLTALSDRPGGETIRWTLIGTGAAIVVIGVIWAPSRIGQRAAGYQKFAIGIGIGVVSILIGVFLPSYPLPSWFAIGMILVWMIEIGVVVGLWHGILITEMRLQPFIVTLCGLLFYRGFARWITGDQTQGFGTGYKGLRELALSRPCSTALLLFLFAIGVILWCGFRWLRKATRESGEPLISGPYIIVAAIVLALASGLEVFMPQEDLKVTLTELSLRVFGMVATAIGTIVLTAMCAIQRRWLIFVALILSLIGLAAVATTFFPSTQEMWVLEQPIDATTVAVVDMTPLAANLGLLAMIVGVPWFVMICWKGAGLTRRSILFFTIISGIYLLAGLTPIDRVEVPAPFLIMTGLALLAGGFLNYTIYGRYLLALGNNEEAARYSGINTKAMVIMAYVICAALAAVAGVLFALDVNSIQPSSQGNFYELYAIAAAVLGGCSLRGGEGSILGVVIGAAVMRVLYNAINMLGISTRLEFAIIGAVILIAVAIDEIFRRVAESRARAAQSV